MNIGTLQSAITEMQSKASDIAGDVDKLSKSCTEGCDTLGTMGSTFGGEIKKFAAEVEKGVGDVLKSFGNISSAVGQAVGKIKEIITGLLPKLGSLPASAIATITASMDSVKDIFTKIKDEVGGQIASLGSTITGMVSTLKGIVAPAMPIGVLAGSCENNMGAIKSMTSGASDLMDLIKGAASSAVETLKTIGTNIVGQASGAVSGLAGQASGAVSGLAGQVSGAVSGLPNLASLGGNEALSVANALKGGAASASISGVNSALADTKAKILEAGSLVKNQIEQNINNLTSIASSIKAPLPSISLPVLPDVNLFQGV